MDEKFNELVFDNFNNKVIDIQQVNINRLKSGFAQTDCGYVKTMLSVIVSHTIQNSFLLDDERLNNVNHLINVLAYGRN